MKTVCMLWLWLRNLFSLVKYLLPITNFNAVFEFNICLIVGSMY